MRGVYISRRVQVLCLCIATTVPMATTVPQLIKSHANGQLADECQRHTLFFTIPGANALVRSNGAVRFRAIAISHSAASPAESYR